MDYELRDTPEEWPIEASEQLAVGHITTYVRDRVRMIDGTVADREYIVHPGAVAVLVLDDQDRVLTIRQYRHPVRRVMVELPAGLLDKPGEHPLEAAKRELYEEAHLQAGDWRVLIDYYNSAGSSGEALRIFVARDPAPAEGARYAGEGEEAGIVLGWVPRAELLAAVMAGSVGTASIVASICALTAALAEPGGWERLRPAEAPWDARPF
jgi:ADP-ribose pyrophosphatase